MHVYITTGHMSLIDKGEPHFFIPHHCVLRPQSLTTKLRVVSHHPTRFLYDTSFISPPSLRLIRWHLKDVPSIFSRRAGLLILRRENDTDILQVYQLNTVTYGVSAALFLATRSLFHLPNLNAATVLRIDLYVDDLLTGADDLHTALQKKEEVSDQLSKAGLTMTKLNRNLSILGSLSDGKVSMQLEKLKSTKMLGLARQPSDDVFIFQFKFEFSETFTRRKVIS